MYCENCGKEVSDDEQVCPYCGALLVPEEAVVNNHVNYLWVILGFLVPIAGLIEFFVFKNKKPLQAKYCGIGALIGFVINLITQLI